MTSEDSSATSPMGIYGRKERAADLITFQEANNLSSIELASQQFVSQQRIEEDWFLIEPHDRSTTQLIGPKIQPIKQLSNASKKVNKTQGQ